MTVESFRWLVTPGCGVAAFLLVYDTHRALRPRIAGEGPWRQSRVLGMATLVLGTFVLQGYEGLDWMSGTIGVVLALALVPLFWSSVTLRRLVADVLRRDPEG
jgi:hypothetical protein